MTERETDLELFAKRRLGTVLRGKYRLDRLLGVGGMAVVYKATHRNQAEFAVKMLHPELSIREDVRTRFLREGYAANSVKHPGAVLVVDDDVAEDGAAFLVMELLDGEGVEAMWERMNYRVPPREASAIGTQLLDVLAAAHPKGIVHRDIKPANLFVTREGVLKVLDFGIARARDAAASGAQGGATTGTGMLLGTPAFMPPEQALARSSDIDGQTDVWAVGATLFSLITGHYVHEGENGPQLMIRAATTPSRLIATLTPDVPPAIARVIDCALAFDKSARWPTAAAMRDALEAASSATFGHVPSKQLLFGVITARDSALGARNGTESARAVALAPTATPAVASMPMAPPQPGRNTPLPSALSARSMPGLAGGTTAQPISNTADAPPVSRRTGGIAVMGVLVAVASFAGFYVLTRPSPPAGTTVIASPASAAMTAAAPADTSTANVASTTDTTLPSAPAAPSLASSALPAHPVAPPPKAKGGHPAAAPAPAPSATASPVASPPATPPPPPRPLPKPAPTSDNPLDINIK